MARRIASIASIVASVFAVAPAQSQPNGGVQPVSSELFLAGYSYGKVTRYYGRSLANFETLTSAQKNDDRDRMVSLSRNLQTYARSLDCSPLLLETIGALQSELSARERPRESRLTELDRFHDCVHKYGSALGGYWWTGRSVGDLSFLFENLEHPQVEMRANSSDRVLLEDLKYLGDNSMPLYGTLAMPPRMELILKALETIRATNSAKSELDEATRNAVKQYVSEIPQSFLPAPDHTLPAARSAQPSLGMEVSLADGVSVTVFAQVSALGGMMSPQSVQLPMELALVIKNSGSTSAVLEVDLTSLVLASKDTSLRSAGFEVWLANSRTLLQRDAEPIPLWIPAGEKAILATSFLPLKRNEGLVLRGKLRGPLRGLRSVPPDAAWRPWPMIGVPLERLPSWSSTFLQDLARH